MDAQLTDINIKTFEAKKACRDPYTKLLAEQARIITRLGEITAILSSGNLPAPQKTTTAPESTIPSDFDRKAYAIGLIWRNPAISTRELARQVGVARSTLSLPSWSDVAAVLCARKNLSRNDYKGYHIDHEDADADERDQ